MQKYLVAFDPNISTHLVHFLEHIFVENYYKKFGFYPYCRTTKNMFSIVSPEKLNQSDIKKLLGFEKDLFEKVKKQLSLEYKIIYNEVDFLNNYFLIDDLIYQYSWKIIYSITYEKLKEIKPFIVKTQIPKELIKSYPKKDIILSTKENTVYLFDFSEEPKNFLYFYYNDINFLSKKINLNIYVDKVGFFVIISSKKSIKEIESELKEKKIFKFDPRYDDFWLKIRGIKETKIENNIKTMLKKLNLKKYLKIITTK